MGRLNRVFRVGLVIVAAAFSVGTATFAVTGSTVATVVHPALVNVH
jgi:hypothetical protein